MDRLFVGVYVKERWREGALATQGDKESTVRILIKNIKQFYKILSSVYEYSPIEALTHKKNLLSFPACTLSIPQYNFCLPPTTYFPPVLSRCIV